MGPLAAGKHRRRDSERDFGENKELYTSLKQGYEVVSFPSPDIKEVIRLFNGIVLGDIQTLNEYLSWDKKATSLRPADSIVRQAIVTENFLITDSDYGSESQIRIWSMMV